MKGIQCPVVERNSRNIISKNPNFQQSAQEILEDAYILFPKTNLERKKLLSN